MSQGKDEIPVSVSSTAITGEQLASAYLDAFSDDELSVRCFPRNETGQKWWADLLDKEIRDPEALFSATVVNDPSGDYVSAFSKWNLPKAILDDGSEPSTVTRTNLLEDATQTLGGEPKQWVVDPQNPRWHVDRRMDYSYALSTVDKLPAWPRDFASDHNVANSFFSRLLDARKEWESSLSAEQKSRGYYYLEMLVTVKRHQGKGLGHKHMTWALERAAKERVPCYVEASPASVEFYSKQGFKPVGRVNIKMDGGGDFFNELMVLNPAEA